MTERRMVRRRGRVVAALPDRHRPLSEGMRIRASILARVLGIKLLNLEASIVVVPESSDAAPPVAGGGRRLADAVRSLDEGAALLEQSRRNGSL